MGFTIVEGIDKRKEYKWYFLQIVMIFFTVLLIFCAKNQFLPITNHYIVDATYYENHVVEAIDRGELYNGFTTINKFLYTFGPQIFIFYNTLLLLSCIYLCILFKVFSPKAVTWARAVIVFNPYFLISAIGPSKECNLTFFSLLSIYLFLKGSFFFRVMAFAVGCVVIFIRPQFGACLFAAYMVYLILFVIKKPMTVCLLMLGSFFFLNAIPAINKLISENQGGDDLPYFAGSSIYQVALVLHAMGKNPILQIPAFIAKMCLVMFTPIARPNPLISDHIPLLDWGYTFMANVLFPLNFGFILLFFNQQQTAFAKIGREGHFLIIYCFIGILSVIISPSIQFRYLFPYIPVIAACFVLHNVKTRNRILIISFSLMIFIFIMTAIFLPKQFGADGYVPLYLSWL